MLSFLVMSSSPVDSTMCGTGDGSSNSRGHCVRDGRKGEAASVAVALKGSLATTETRLGSLEPLATPYGMRRKVGAGKKRTRWWSGGLAGKRKGSCPARQKRRRPEEKRKGSCPARDEDPDRRPARPRDGDPNWLMETPGARRLRRGSRFPSPALRQAVLLLGQVSASLPSRPCCLVRTSNPADQQEAALQHSSRQQQSRSTPTGIAAVQKHSRRQQQSSSTLSMSQQNVSGPSVPSVNNENYDPKNDKARKAKSNDPG
ncbi:hypothetical protein GUJ93_ZPchr0013g36574 [Zizania palustris]|uniref:Uncharacterized protein n=1 Tax=Zizania palustris TaxID=103762 RepID=A0A8J5X5M3_ZIZPA|nr:hypothetical protein GUJ93_ZPchr0013g36574 [Zizania palustris]